jgi:hypothetical protein
MRTPPLVVPALEVTGRLEQPRPYVLLGFFPSQRFSERGAPAAVLVDDD